MKRRLKPHKNGQKKKNSYYIKRKEALTLQGLLTDQ